jgi:ADP-ribosylglycohydrolase
MLGAIVGDIVGSVYEWDNHKSVDFPFFVDRCFFTDDSVMTVAVADALLSLDWNGLVDDDLVRGAIRASLVNYGKSYPDAGYGAHFREWIFSEEHFPYGSYGNGSAMRVSSVAYFASSLEGVLRLARLSAEVSHDHPEGIKGAEAVAGCVFLARTGVSKDDIRSFVESGYYDVSFCLDDIRPGYVFDVSCQGSVPVAIRAFLEGDSFESVVRLAVSVGGDSDTIAAMAGSIGGAFYGVPEDFEEIALSRLDDRLREVVGRFNLRIGV